MLKTVRSTTALRTGALAEGTLEVLPSGVGFLRQPERDYLAAPDDVCVPATLIRQLALRTGMTLQGPQRPVGSDPSAHVLTDVDHADGEDAATRANRTPFDELTPLHPTAPLTLETDAGEIAMRVIDLLTPVGKGQRGLIVAPPRTGKTVLLQKITQSLLTNHPECYVLVLLIDERPEEVTDLRRTVKGTSADVVASTFDCPPDEHVHVANLVLEKAKRRVECGQDVVILLDSLTRLARAHNALAPWGRLGSGGLTIGALDQPRQFFGAARNVEEGGSLTILATALIDTGSRMDEVIFEEFKGTGNMELYLDRRLAEKRVWPAIDIKASGTRREEVLLGSRRLLRIRLLRQALSSLNGEEAVQRLTARLARTTSNAEFLDGLPL